MHFYGKDDVLEANDFFWTEHPEDGSIFLERSTSTRQLHFFSSSLTDQTKEEVVLIVNYHPSSLRLTSLLNLLWKDLFFFSMFLHIN